MGGAAGEATARLPDAVGGQGLPQPTYDSEARARYEAARTATQDRVNTFEKGAPGKALAPGQTTGTFKLPDSQVAAQFFNSGKRAAESAQEFVRAAGGQQQAVEALQD